MKLVVKILLYLVGLAAIGCIVFGAVMLFASPENESPPDPNDEVIGIWLGFRSEMYYAAGKPVIFASRIYLRFEASGAIYTRIMSYCDGKLLQDSDWTVTDTTWSYQSPHLRFSNGRSFLIKDETFSDKDTNGNVIYYRKLTEELSSLLP